MESTGLHWLAQAAPDPESFREQWERTGLGLVLLPAGRRWDVLSVPARLGRPAVDLLGAATCGPVLTDFGDEYVGFLVPAGTAARWVGTGVRCAGRAPGSSCRTRAGAAGASAGWSRPTAPDGSTTRSSSNSRSTRRPPGSATGEPPGRPPTGGRADPAGGRSRPAGPAHRTGPRARLEG